MKYDEDHGCEQCGMPAPRSALCDGCEVAERLTKQHDKELAEMVEARDWAEAQLDAERYKTAALEAENERLREGNRAELPALVEMRARLEALGEADDWESAARHWHQKFLEETQKTRSLPGLEAQIRQLHRAIERRNKRITHQLTAILNRNAKIAMLSAVVNRLNDLAEHYTARRPDDIDDAVKNISCAIDTLQLDLERRDEEMRYVAGFVCLLTGRDVSPNAADIVDALKDNLVLSAPLPADLETK